MTDSENRHEMGTNIRVLHWNILAKSLAEGFDGVEQKYLDWEYRYPLVVNKIKSFSPDIISLQEVEIDQYSDLKKAFPDYLGIYTEKVKDVDDNGIDSNHGTAIFINKKFRLHEGHWERLGGSQIFSSIIINHIDEPNKIILFGGCHLKAKPGFEMTRLGQVTNIHLFINKNFKDIRRQIIVGDFNDVPESMCIESMASDYKMYHPEFTTHKSRGGKVVKRVIDYMFYKGVNLSETYETLPLELLPNKDFPSDHLPLVVDFEI